MSPSDRGWALWLLAALALVAAWVHWTPPLRAAVGHLAPLAFSAVFVASFAGFGAPLARRLLPRAGRLDQVLVSVALGTGITGLVTFGQGVMGVVDPARHALWTLAGLALFAWVLLGHWCRSFCGACSAGTGARSTWWPWRSRSSSLRCPFS